jgi:hypothetical protein
LFKNYFNDICSLSLSLFLCLLSLRYWGLNSRLWAWEAGTLLLEPHPSPFHSGYFGDRVWLFVQVGLDHSPSILGFPPLLGWQACATIQLFSCWELVSRTFFFSRTWPRTAILPSSASQVARLQVWTTSTWLLLIFQTLN